MPKKKEKQFDSLIKMILRGMMPDDEESTTKLMRKLSSDMKDAGKLLTRDEARYIIDLYYQIQDFRISSANQVRALSKEKEPTELIEYFGMNFAGMESQIKSIMGTFSSEYAIGSWLQSICGIGPVLSAAFLVTFSILHRKTAGAWHAYAGMAPGIEWKKGEKRPFDARAKVFMFKAGESFVKVQNNESDFYGKLYAKQKEYYLGKNERGEFSAEAEAKLARFKIGKNTDAYKAYSIGKLPPAHIHSMARRYASKIFLSHLHDLAWEDYYGEKAPCPYVFSDKFKGGVHKHFIEPPNPHKLVGRPLIDLFGTEEEDLARKEARAKARAKNKTKE